MSLESKNPEKAKTTRLKKPTNPLRRMISLLRVGPRGIALRFYEQFRRKRTGVPVWRLAQVRPFLYLGGQHYKKGWKAFEAEGITAILNMRESHHDDVALGIGGASHLHLPTLDNTPLSTEFLHQAADFIASEKEAGGKVYVHCGVGVGRAPSAAASYLIKHEGLSAAEALAAIKKVRPFVHLTPEQWNALEDFEKGIEG
jgi:hypothetical protein